MQVFSNAKLRLQESYRTWQEKRAEKAEAKKALHAASASEHGHGRFFLLTVPAMATIFAAFVEVYWAILFCIEATGRIDGNIDTATGSGVPGTFVWNFAFSGHLPVLIGLIAATAPIVMISMVWLPVQFAMRGFGRWRRGTLIAVGLLANALVIVSGTVVMNHNRQEQVRDAVVVEQTATQGRAAIDARLQFEQEQLRLALANTNPYLNQAANVGAEEWERSYVAQARATNDPRLPQLERALGAARAADARRANIERLTVERATAAPEAASAAVVEDTVGAELNTFAQLVEVWRPPFVALIATLIGVLGAWWTLAMLQGLNPRDVLRSGWADEGHRIEDLRHEPVRETEPLTPIKRRYTDADTGDEIEESFVRAHKRERKIKRGEKTRVEVRPDIPPDETGAKDGGNRTASVTIGGLMEATPDEAVQPAPVIDAEPESVAEQADSGEVQENTEQNQADLSDELPIFEDETSAEAGDETQDAEPVESVQDQDAEPDQQRAPETDPARLIAAE